MVAYLIIRTFFTQTHWQKRPVSKDLFCKLARSSRKAKWKFKFIFATFCHGQIIPYLVWSPSKCRRLFCVSKIEFLLKNEVTKPEEVFFIHSGKPMRLFNWLEVFWLFMLISSGAEGKSKGGFPEIWSQESFKRIERFNQIPRKLKWLLTK